MRSTFSFAIGSSSLRISVIRVGAEATEPWAALEPPPVRGRLDDDGRCGTTVGGLSDHPTGLQDGASGAFRVSRTVASLGQYRTNNRSEQGWGRPMALV
jgi:hypothetical protein